MQFRKSCMAAAVFAVLGAQAQIGQNPIPPYTACTGTGGGTCNLGFVGFIDGPDVTWWWATIYNNACQIIGGVYGNLDCCGPFSIDSQLPYTVDITNLPETGNYNALGFKYAGFTSQGNFACSKQTVQGVQLNVCQHAFPC